MYSIELIAWAQRKASESEKVKELAISLENANNEELKALGDYMKKEVNRVKKHKKIIDYDIFNIMVEQYSDPRKGIFDFAAFMLIDKKLKEIKTFF